ncbi:MAG TPA: DUF2127 domain-containing protein [Isosphaeraceae bacterium]|jgi:uncharacterized membrane protein (DUF2068 family)|nr:DUF2127 domain-containing protein [Isosphaeraceae bacterium]
MNHAKQSGPLGFRVIGALKLATALLLAAAGFGIFRLMNKDLGEAMERFVTRLHLDPDSRLVHTTFSRLASIDPARLKAIGAGTFFYAVLELVEGTGLLLRKAWAEYLTVIATASLLPLEIYELARKMSLVRVTVLVVNVAILIYLIVKLIQQHRAQSERTPPPAGGGEAVVNARAPRPT